jgi:transcriptional regulator with XRE-family HTH domain
MSVGELAKAAGVYPKTIYRIEAGDLATGMPQMATIRRVADALGCTVVELLGDEVMYA